LDWANVNIEMVKRAIENKIFLDLKIVCAFDFKKRHPYFERLHKNQK
jgi:hypothetical protein